MDKLEDAWRHKELREELVGGTNVPIVQRSLTDGRQFHVVKVFWSADELESKLRGLGWDVCVHPIGPFFWAEAQFPQDVTSS